MSCEKCSHEYPADCCLHCVIRDPVLRKQMTRTIQKQLRTVDVTSAEIMAKVNSFDDDMKLLAASAPGNMEIMREGAKQMVILDKVSWGLNMPELPIPPKEETKEEPSKQEAVKKQAKQKKKNKKKNPKVEK